MENLLQLFSNSSNLLIIGLIIGFWLFFKLRKIIGMAFFALSIFKLLQHTQIAEGLIQVFK